MQTISEVQLVEVEIPFIKPWKTGSWEQATKCAVVVVVRGDGVEGFAEASADGFPGYTYETSKTAFEILKSYLVPTLFDCASRAEWGEKIAWIKGHNFARSGLDMALWDWECKRNGTNLAQVLGANRTSVPSGISLGVESSVDALLKIIEGHLANNVQRVKLKIKPGYDVSYVDAVRNAWPSLPLQVDANGSYSLDQAVKLMQDLAPYNLLLVEEPTYEGVQYYAQLRKRLGNSTSAPLCLDESIKSLRDLEAALELGVLKPGDSVNLKPGRVGGFEATRRILQASAQAGLACWAGGMMEVVKTNLIVAALPECNLVGDVSPMGRFYAEELVNEPVVLGADGHIQLPSGPGTGFTLNWAVVARYMTATATLRA